MPLPAPPKEVEKKIEDDPGVVARLRWKPPAVAIGQVVLWYPFMERAGGQEPMAAIVVKVGARTINVHVFQEMGRFTYRDSVRFQGDPDNDRHLDSEGGTWDFTDESKMLHQLGKGLVKVRQVEKEEPKAN